MAKKWAAAHNIRQLRQKKLNHNSVTPIPDDRFIEKAGTKEVVINGQTVTVQVFWAAGDAYKRSQAS